MTEKSPYRRISERSQVYSSCFIRQTWVMISPSAPSPGGGREFCGGGQLVYGPGQMPSAKLLGEPLVEWSEDGVLAHGDVARVLDVVGQSVFAREAAPVIRCGVGPVALHAPVA